MSLQEHIYNLQKCSFGNSVMYINVFILSSIIE